MLFDIYIRNRKHVPCFYRVTETRVEVWENEKCCWNTSRRRVFPQLFRVLPNFHECFFNLIETRRTCFLFLLENTATKKAKQLVNFDYQNVNSLCSRHQCVLVLCFYRVIETRLLTNQRAYFLRTNDLLILVHVGYHCCTCFSLLSVCFFVSLFVSIIFYHLVS